MGWDKVETVLPYAKAIVFDGCHKIYLAMDEEQIDRFEKYGYGSDSGSLLIRAKAVDDKPGFGDSASALATLQEWWDESCGLRFVSAVVTDENGEDEFKNLIRQFELDEDVDDDDLSDEDRYGDED